jgi:hypothetical protein
MGGGATVSTRRPDTPVGLVNLVTSLPLAISTFTTAPLLVSPRRSPTQNDCPSTSRSRANPLTPSAAMSYICNTAPLELKRTTCERQATMTSPLLLIRRAKHGAGRPVANADSWLFVQTSKRRTEDPSDVYSIVH